MASSTRLRVYFIENVETGRIKVGFTTGAIAKRLQALQTGSDCELRLLGVVLALEDYGTTESQLHLRFSQYQHRGEWFSREILPMILDLLREEEARRGLL